MNKKTCNQCHKQMDMGVRFSVGIMGSACDNPECPNYALVQIPLEEMGRDKKRMANTKEREPEEENK